MNRIMRGCREGKCRRSSRGGVLLFAVAAVGLLGVLAAAGVLLLVNFGISSYYQQKVQTVADNAAQFAASRAGRPNVGDETRDLVNNLLQQMGLPRAHEIAIEQTGDGSQVTVNVNSLPLFGKAEMLPATISITAIGRTARFADCKAYLQLEYDDSYNHPSGHPKISGGAYAPVLSQEQLDPKLKSNIYMLDTNDWPETVLFYHKIYSNFPNYR